MKLNRLFQFLIIASLLMAGMGSASQPALAAKAQPLLMQIAAQDSDQQVSVIVQKLGATDAAENLVTRLNGKVTKDLHIINAFAAEMSAEAALELARSVAVRWVSLDAAMVGTGGPDGTVNTSNLLNVYNKAIGADKLWAQGYQGSSVTVAIVDSGIKDSLSDLKSGKGSRVIGAAKFSNLTPSFSDQYGHGTHVAGIIAGNGTLGSGTYIGIAPKVKLVNVKICDDEGSATESEVVSGLQWVMDNKAKYNIRVVNISLNSSLVQSYHTSPLDAAVEILWFNGIVVVVSSGNNGTTSGGVLYPPANDPFAITVGAVDDKGTTGLNDDLMASFSAYGTTSDGFTKPDLVAPGKNIVSLLVAANGEIALAHPANIVGTNYYRMSGTSFSAPIVSGAVALLLQDEPNLTPDQVKYRLMNTANKTWTGYNPSKAGAGYLDIYAAVYGTSLQSANTNILPSQLLTTGTDPITFGSVGWNSVGWNSVGWNSVGWNSVGWNSVGWNSDYWGP